jgi:hypothetical protein
MVREMTVNELAAGSSIIAFSQRMSCMSEDQILRQHLVELLQGGHAHLDFEKATADMPIELCGIKPVGLPFTIWRLVEHMRIAQWDIVQFSIDPKHVSPEFPVGYWPEEDGPSDLSAWNDALKRFRADLKTMVDLVTDPQTNLYVPITHGQGQTILREALLVADHNAYHLGQLTSVRRLLNTWHDI